jgi:hypothetical protein
MSFKFLVGQAVEYTPIGEKKPGRFKIVRQMPLEDHSIDVYYRIKSETESYERNVAEGHLNLDRVTDDTFASVDPGESNGAEGDQKLPS